MNGNRLKAAPLTWRKVHGSKFYEIANPVRFVSISVKAFMKDGKRGPVVAGARWTVTAWAANEQEKLTLSCGVASDMHAAKRICQNWWCKSVRSLRGSVVAVCEGD